MTGIKPNWPQYDLMITAHLNTVRTITVLLFTINWVFPNMNANIIAVTGFHIVVSETRRTAAQSQTPFEVKSREGGEEACVPA